MTKFTDAGYGVIFGEYAVALNADGSVKDTIHVISSITSLTTVIYIIIVLFCGTAQACLREAH